MKKIYPLGNKIEQLINKTRDTYVENLLKEATGNEYDDVPDVNWDSEYHTEVPLSGLPPGGYGYPTKDSAYDEERVNILVGKDNYIKPDVKIIIPKKKKKFIVDEPPKENFHEDPDVKFEDIELKEQEAPPVQKSKQKPITDPNTGEVFQNPEAAAIDPNTSIDQSAGGMYQDPNAMGGMGLDKPKTAEEIGRIFELKKIYSRLISVEEYLSFSPDEILITLRNYVSKCIELFETLISNVDAFKDQIDDIIVVFYKFLERVYAVINRYYKVKNKEEGDQKNKTSLFTKPEVVYSKKGSFGPESNSHVGSPQDYNTLR